MKWGIIVIFVLMSCCALACEVIFQNNLADNVDSLTIGIDPEADDDLDGTDVLQQPPPPAGKFVEFVSVLSGDRLTVDKRDSAENEWDINLIALDMLGEGISGTDTMTWTVADCSGVEFMLVDYGSDDTRTDDIDEIDMMDEDSYSFTVSNAIGSYRYLAIESYETEECVEEWDCSEWSDCTEDEIQYRVCVEESSCNTTYDKPEEERACEFSCAEDWECGEWSSCANGVEARVCVDKNDCGTTEYKPSDTRDCAMEACQPDIECTSWGECIDGVQVRECVDVNLCDGQLPEMEKACVVVDTADMIEKITAKVKNGSDILASGVEPVVENPVIQNQVLPKVDYPDPIKEFVIGLIIIFLVVGIGLGLYFFFT